MDTHDGPGTSFLDEDIDFDFFDADDEEIRSSETKRPRKARSAYKPKRVGRNPNWSRIAVAVSTIVVAGAILVMAGNAWMDHRRTAAFEDYFKEVASVTQASAAQGSELTNLLEQPAGDRARLVERLDRISEQSASLVRQADRIESPKQLRETHAWLVTTMQYRQNGVESFATAFLAALDAQTAAAGVQPVVESQWRMLASDVIFTDSYVSNAQKIMGREGVKGVAVPDSVFVTGELNSASEEAAKLLIERFRAVTPSSGKKSDGPVTGLHGNTLTNVIVQPAGIELAPGTVAEVDGSTELAFEVSVENGGESQEVQVPITIDIRGSASEPQRLEGIIDVIDPKQVLAVSIPVDEIPPFGEVLDVTVTVGKVPGEENLDNNTGTYQVMFSL